MRRPGSQTGASVPAFQDALPANMQRAQKADLTNRIRRVLDAKKEPVKDWVGTLADMIANGSYPTPETIDHVIKSSGAKTATTGEVHYLCMGLDSRVLMASLERHGVKVIDDGNRYR